MRSQHGYYYEPRLQGQGRRWHSRIDNNDFRSPALYFRNNSSRSRLPESKLWGTTYRARVRWEDVNLKDSMIHDFAARACAPSTKTPILPQGKPKVFDNRHRNDADHQPREYESDSQKVRFPFHARLLFLVLVIGQLWGVDISVGFCMIVDLTFFFCLCLAYLYLGCRLWTSAWFWIK